MVCLVAPSLELNVRLEISLRLYPIFFFFRDFMVYWNHRLLYQVLSHKYSFLFGSAALSDHEVHAKPHHTYLFTTPYSSHAVHFLMGGDKEFLTISSFPTSHFITFFLWPVLVRELWTISIHDQIIVATPVVIRELY